MAAAMPPPSISVPPLCQCVATEILRGQPCCGEAWHGCLYLEPRRI